MNTIEIPTVLDVQGNTLTQGAIVQILKPAPEEGTSPFAGHRGVIVSPYEPLEDDPQYSVPVFFFQEVASHYFWHTPDQKILLTQWQKEHAEALREGDPSFLFREENRRNKWQNCPCVRFFMPTEMVVCKGFTPDDMIARLFGTNYHTSRHLTEHIPQDPDACQCFLEGCGDFATNLTHYNVWGCITPMYTCLKHHKQWNGVWTDGPSLKTGIYLRDGSLLQVPSRV